MAEYKFINYANSCDRLLIRMFHTLANPFVNEKPPLQSNLITAARRMVHQAKDPWKLHILPLLNLSFLVSQLNKTKKANQGFW